MSKKVERKPDAMFTARGYTIDCYCCECGVHQDFASDGYYAYSYAHKAARKAGWKLHKDGYSTCKECVQKSNSQNQQ